MKTTRSPRKLSTTAEAVSLINPISFALREARGEKAEVSAAAKEGADAVQNVVDLVGLLDPTGISHLSNMVVALMRARHETDKVRRRELMLRAAVSGVGAVPILGKWAVAGRMAGGATTSQGILSTLGQAARRTTQWAASHPGEAFTVAEGIASLLRPMLIPREDETPHHRVEKAGQAIATAGGHLREGRDEIKGADAFRKALAATAGAAWAAWDPTTFAHRRQMVKARRFFRGNKELVGYGGALAAFLAADAAISWRDARRRRREMSEEAGEYDRQYPDTPSQPRPTLRDVAFAVRGPGGGGDGGRLPPVWRDTDRWPDPRRRIGVLGAAADLATAPFRLVTDVVGHIVGAFTALATTAMNVTAKFVLITQAARMTTNALLWLQHPYSQYSARMQEANIRAQAAQIRRDRIFAQNVGRSYATLQESRNYLEDTVRPYRETGTEAGNYLLAMLNGNLTVLIRVLELFQPALLANRFARWLWGGGGAGGPAAQIIIDAAAKRAAALDAPTSPPPRRGSGRSRY